MIPLVVIPDPALKLREASGRLRKIPLGGIVYSFIR